tara:strand:+ start:306 stop:608 length:303 start_codon:yes stop_codon:yes gene_type:complete
MTIWVIKDAEGNVTNPGIKANEDFVKEHYNHYEAFVAPSDVANRAEIDARMWRDQELLRTDSLMGLSDYPNTSALTTYRQELRDWPSTDAFPDTQPTLGS